MESLSKQELISTITKQADQIKRYETRLRDVVTAYKGLAKEKEALENSLKALNKPENVAVEGDNSKLSSLSDDSLSALTLSLSTLTEEKSRMEEAFQADKKVTKAKYDSMIATMREENKSLIQQHQAEVNNLKAKIAYEIQEREKDTADHAAIMKELQAKMTVEIKSNQKLEDKFANSTDAQVSTAELEKRVRDLSGELEAARRRLLRAEARTAETPAVLVRLQEKVALLEKTHALAVNEEIIKAKRAEESARKVCARQEERVATLEEKLAELSQTVGEYDARRRRDQATIHQLKESLNTRLLDKFAVKDASFEQSSQKSETDSEKLADSEYLHNLIDKIHILKKELLAENEKLGSPIDASTIFRLEGYENVHNACKEEVEKVKAEFDMYKRQNVRNSGSDLDYGVKVRELNGIIEELKDQLVTQTVLLDEERRAKENVVKSYEEKLKSESDFHKEASADLRTRIQALEKQVQTQRDRYAALLEETDSYIRTRSDRSRKVSAEEGHGLMAEPRAPPHMLHYAHELARRDLDIAQLRRDQHATEGRLRDSQRDSTIEKDRFKEVLRTLKEEIERLRRSQSREGANLEYLKNVVMAYLMSRHDAGRRHMLNAIAAVLHFTEGERDAALAGL